MNELFKGCDIWSGEQTVSNQVKLMHTYWTMENNSQTNGKLQILTFGVKIDSDIVVGIANACANFEIEKSKGNLS